MYLSVFGEGQRGFAISTKRGERVKRPPTGVYERLLCRDCENKLSDWESYGRGILLGGAGFWARETPFGWAMWDLNYESFKLFQLSILWKAAVSPRSEFAGVVLGADDRERLREMHFSGNPGNPRDFGCLILASPELMRKFGDLVIMPEMLDGERGQWCRFIFGGMFWCYCTPTAEPEAETTRSVINELGELHVLRNSEHAQGYMNRFVDELVASGNLPAS